MKLYHPLALAFGLEILTLVAQGQPGAIDPSFGTNGFTLPAIGPSSVAPYDLVILPDDRIVVVGSVNNTLTGFDWFVSRFLPDGAIDTTFGTEGVATFHLLGTDRLTDVQLLHDGKLLLAGMTYASPYTLAALARVDTNGVLDSGFGSNGITVLSTEPTHFENRVSDLMVLPDSSILLLGWVDRDTLRYDEGASQGLWHILQDGTPDQSFGNASPLVERDLFMDQLNDRAQGFTLRSDGRLVVVGGSYIGPYERWSLAYWNTDGSIPSGFNEAYYPITPNQFNEALDVLAMSNGDQLVVGEAGNDLTIARIDPLGLVVPSYGTEGLYRIDLGLGNTSVPVEIAPSAGGQLLVLGSIFRQFTGSIYLNRLDLDTGMPDLGFGDTSLVEWRVYPDSSTVAGAMGLQSDGRIVVAGYYFGINTSKPFLVRFNNDLSVDVPYLATPTSIGVYPNPFDRTMTVTGTATGGRIDVVDPLGRLIWSGPSDPTSTVIQLPPGCAGVYLVRYLNGGYIDTVHAVRTAEVR